MWCLFAVALIAAASCFIVKCDSKFIRLDSDARIRGRKFTQPYSMSNYAKMKDRIAASSSIHIEDRLAVMIAFSFPLDANASHWRLRQLRCSLHKLYQNVKTSTPTDVFLWLNESTISLAPAWLTEDFPDLYLMPIDPNCWRISSDLSPSSQWMFGRNFNAGYHIMGRWRLSYAPDFAHFIGYKYMMYLDDDAFVFQPFGNIVAHFNKEKVGMAFRNKVYDELPEAVTGLAELARYWMVSRNVAVPNGPLLDHVQNGTIDNLSTEKWDKHIYLTAFTFINLDFWFEEPVQDFLDLVFSTGGDFLMRWIDQGVLNMVQLLFLDDENLFLFPQLSAFHDKVADPRIFRLIGCDFVNDPPIGQYAAGAVSTGSNSNNAVLVTAQSTLDGQQVLTQDPAIIRVEFLILWEVFHPKSVAFEKLKEFFLFSWLFNTASCGADTVVLNNYNEYRYEADRHHLRDYWWWHAYEVEEKMGKLFLQGGVARTDEDDTRTYSTACRDVARQQLEEYVEFYCAYTGIHHGKPMLEECNNIRSSVFATFNTLL